jgi:hypothetical protein
MTVSAAAYRRAGFYRALRRFFSPCAPPVRESKSFLPKHGATRMRAGAISMQARRFESLIP